MKIKSMIEWYKRQIELSQDAAEEQEYRQSIKELEAILNGKR